MALTTEERAWLDANPDKLRLYFNTDFPPIEFLSKTGTFVGMGADVIRLIEERLNISFHRIPSTDWNKHLAALESGECAIAPTIVRTAERERYAFFTTPYATVPVVLITSQSVRRTVSLDNLPGRRVGVVSGYATEKYLRELAQGRYDVLPVASVSEGLRSLSFGQLDAFVENLAVAAYHIQKDGLPNLRVAGNTDYAFAWSIGVSRHYPLLFSAIDKAMATLSQEELEDIRDSWISLGGGGMSLGTRRMLESVALFAVLLLLGLAGISFILKRRLDEKVATLKNAQEQIVEQADLLRLAIEATQAGVWDLRPDKGIHYVSVSNALPVTGNDGEKTFIPLEQWSAHIHPDDMPVLRDVYRSYLVAGGRIPFEVEFRLGNARDGWRWVLSKGMAVEVDQRGRPARIIGLDFNIQALKQAQEDIAASEARFRSLFEMAPLPLAMSSPDGRIFRVNDRFTRVLGYTAEDLPAFEDWWRLAYPDPEYRRELMNAWQAAAGQLLTDDSAVVSKECRVTGKNGEERTMVIGARRAGDTILVSFFDISDRKLAEEALNRERDNLRAILYASPIASLVFDMDGRAVDANPAFEQLFGRDRSQWLGGRWGDLVGCPRRIASLQGCGHLPECINCVFFQAIREGLQHRTRTREEQAEAVLTGDGVERRLWFQYSIEPFVLNGQNHVVVALDDITSRKQAEEALRISEEKLRSLFAAMQDIVLVLDRDGRYLEIAPTDTALLYRPPDMLLGKLITELFPPEKASRYLETIRQALAVGRPVSLDYDLEIDGRMVWFAAIVAPLSEDRVVWIARDITGRKMAEEERQRMQEQLLQAQKLEAIGILAGGVAHDFNNMLGAIIGYADLTMAVMDSTDPLRPNIAKILDAAQRSANLTRQLLAFARKQAVMPVLLDLNEAIAGTITMLQRLIGENISLIWRPEPEPILVRIDPSQLDQLLANLCVNARDAIGSNIGKIVIETATVSIDASSKRMYADAQLGEYVLLSVGDNGCGMSRQVRERIFEPFFTTKEMGKGTGLGLPTVYGIVKQNGGFINVYSEPGEGTLFRIYLPLQRGEAGAVGLPDVDDIPCGHGETVLIVEDDPTLLDMGMMMLGNLGYSVTAAATPMEAIGYAGEVDRRIDLFIIDVVMPEMNGQELVDRLRRIRPTMRYLFMSGYTADIIENHGEKAEGVNFIQKPFTLKDLATKVRSVLDLAAADGDGRAG